MGPPRIVTVLLLLGAAAGLLYATAERVWLPVTGIGAGGSAASTIHVDITERAQGRQLVVALRFANVRPVPGLQMALQVDCGSARLMAGTQVASPQPAAVAGWSSPLGQFCVGSSMPLPVTENAFADQAVLLVFDTPPGLGRDLSLQMPQIRCTGPQCPDLRFPGVIEFHKTIPQRDFTLHG